MRLKNEVKSLLAAATANASGGWVSWNGGAGTFTTWGTYDTSTVKLEFSPDGGTTVIEWDSSNTTVTAAAHYGIAILPQGLYRATLSSVGASTSVSAQLSPAE